MYTYSGLSIQKQFQGVKVMSESKCQAWQHKNVEIIYGNFIKLKHKWQTWYYTCKIWQWINILYNQRNFMKQLLLPTTQ